MADLTLDEKTHTYFWNGKKVPSVNQVIDSAGFKNYEVRCGQCDTQIHSFVSDEIMERASEFGKSVHRGCELICHDELDWSSISPLLKPYLEGCQKFLEDNDVTIFRTEMMNYSEKFNCAGTLDAYGYLEKEKKRVILDWKSGKKSKKNRLQLAGYSAIYDPTAIRIAVYLGPEYENNYSRERFESDEDLDAFKAALEIAKWKRTKQFWNEPVRKKKEKGVLKF